jgi:hypothetical protein
MLWFTDVRETSLKPVSDPHGFNAAPNSRPDRDICTYSGKNIFQKSRIKISVKRAHFCQFHDYWIRIRITDADPDLR